MKYYVPTSQANEINSRMEYLTKVFRAHFIQTHVDLDFICLESFPLHDDGIRFITGHENQVHELLSKNPHMPLSVLNTCFPQKFKHFIAGSRKIYFCKTDSSGYARLRSGTEYGLGFDVLDSELLLLNSTSSNIITRLDDSYILLER